MRLALRLAAALAACVVTFDAAIDGAVCMSTGHEDTACHACACGPRLTAGRIAAVAVQENPRPIAAFVPVFHAPILPKSIFHPPTPAA
jgi:hypothetical protein